MPGFLGAGGKLTQLSSRVGGLQGALEGTLGAAGAGAIAGVPGIPVAPGMDSGSGSPVQRNYVGPRRKVIHWPGAKGAPEPEPEPDPEPLWTPATITSSFTGMATAAAVTGGGVVVATKAPSLFMTWLPRILIVLAVLLIVGLLIYYAFLHKANKEEEQN